MILQTPGVVQDSHGQLHIRGDHANVQYRINGVIIPEPISGFGQALETRFADHLSILTTRVAVVNLFDRVYQLRDGSGIGVGAPQHGMRRTLYAGVNKPF